MEWQVGFALLLSAFCVVAPTLLYVGLVRGLERLRDDPFVEQVLLQMDEAESGSGAEGGPKGGAWRAFAPSLPGSDADRTNGRDGRAVGDGPTCSRCGAPNPEYTRFCGVCLAKITK
ncbi:zinc ribbon domain-containing protein [Halogeometricum sp. S1BR25-6]|uniref:Zinc ribbon domain-containing protein n=1 Tax=Halogeometricum salsisoli TaxID=2950536 RepID=A0ABU2GEW7_9EURY|nr:zinc ribbon domain-containing protein [Halogeometricum sp. S1BR25-6]MDS0299350.1 zinc ribbon domain-containing protein [Halogeometricum sp. S1BR25-6]